MTEVEKWQLFHSYQRLVDSGFLNPLKCSICDNKVVTRVGPHDEVRLWCAQCDLKFKPGLDVITRVKAGVSEWT
jgi:hypothetical protein